jgi:hypothetical protein
VSRKAEIVAVTDAGERLGRAAVDRFSHGLDPKPPFAAGAILCGLTIGEGAMIGGNPAVPARTVVTGRAGAK